MMICSFIRIRGKSVPESISFDEPKKTIGCEQTSDSTLISPRPTVQATPDTAGRLTPSDSSWTCRPTGYGVPALAGQSFPTVARPETPPPAQNFADPAA